MREVPDFISVLLMSKNRFDHKALLTEFISQKNYPCVAAVQALHRDEIMFDAYTGFGSGSSSEALLKNLLKFKSRQTQGSEDFLTYVAIFEDEGFLNEEQFENKLWRELSALWDYSHLAGLWDEKFSDDPMDTSFCFSLDGAAFFVVGMHPRSSRHSRRYPCIAVAFNLYSQFESLMARGKYDGMVKLNRQRDIKFQGSINPMVEKYHDIYEPIQFSGRHNDENWKCPFTRGLKQGLEHLMNKAGF